MIAGLEERRRGGRGLFRCSTAQVSLLYLLAQRAAGAFPWSELLGSYQLLAMPSATQRPWQAPNTNPPLKQPRTAALPCSCSQELCITLPTPGKSGNWRAAPARLSLLVTPQHLKADLIQVQCPTHQHPSPQPPQTHREERGVFGVWVEPLLPAG